MQFARTNADAIVHKAHSQYTSADNHTYMAIADIPMKLLPSTQLGKIHQGYQENLTANTFPSAIMPLSSAQVLQKDGLASRIAQLTATYTLPDTRDSINIKAKVRTIFTFSDKDISRTVTIEDLTVSYETVNRYSPILKEGVTYSTSINKSATLAVQSCTEAFYGQSSASSYIETIKVNYDGTFTDITSFPSKFRLFVNGVALGLVDASLSDNTITFCIPKDIDPNALEGNKDPLATL